ncbi:MAG: hypothetical protein QOJ98_450 [Acidobacteriota bacterium]|jgi:hypothetical protein|nr:hypothetical protein [Acidobacteriota bacterium]
MTEKKTIDNTNRPAQPEPGEDEAVQQPSVREESGDTNAIGEAERKERKRQTGQ